MQNDPDQHYYLYVPECEIRGVWVSVHGISINAKSHADMLASYAEQSGLLLVVPVFSKEHCPSYNIFGKAENGFRGDIRLLEILKEVQELTGIHTGQFFLMGYSAGGQFSHRFVMNYPEKVRAAVICSPGFFTFPTEEADYPYGLRGMSAATGRRYDQKAFLQVPMLINVGEEDTLRTSNLLQREDVDRLQGVNRVERAKNWFDAIQALCEKEGIESDHRFCLLHGVGHGFEATIEKTDLGKMASDFFCAHI